MAHTGLNSLLGNPGLLDFGRLRDLNALWIQQAAIGAITDSRTSFFAKELGQGEEAFLSQLGVAIPVLPTSRAAS